MFSTDGKGMPMAFVRAVVALGRENASCVDCDLGLAVVGKYEPMGLAGDGDLECRAGMHLRDCRQLTDDRDHGVAVDFIDRHESVRPSVYE